MFNFAGGHCRPETVRLPGKGSTEAKDRRNEKTDNRRHYSSAGRRTVAPERIDTEIVAARRHVNCGLHLDFRSKVGLLLTLVGALVWRNMLAAGEITRQGLKLVHQFKGFFRRRRCDLQAGGIECGDFAGKGRARLLV